MNMNINSSVINKYAFILLAFMFLGFNSNAQTENEYHAENEGWLVRIDEAYKQSKETGYPILANFTGSNWCGWCKKLTRSVFSRPEFKKWAKEHVILLELDFPKGAKLKTIPIDIQQQNNSLKQAFQINGLPSVWVFDLDQNMETKQFSISALGRTGYTETAKKFISDIETMIARRPE